MFSLILSYLVIILAYYYTPINLFSFLFMIDSIYSSLKFLFIFILSNNKNIILNKYDTLYNINIIDRYIYYFIISFIFYIFTLFFWTEKYIYIYLLFGCPESVNICSYYINKEISYIKTQFENIIKLICSIQIAIILEDISEKINKKKYKINKYDIYYSLFIDSNLKISLIEFFKHITVIILLIFFKQKYNYFYKYIIKAAYNITYGKTNYNTNILNDIQDIIEQKKWYMLNNPNTIRTIIKLIQNNPDKNIGILIINEIKYGLAKCISILPICNYIDNIIIIPILFIFCLIFEYIKFDITNIKKKILLIIISSIIGICINNYIITIILCYFSIYIKINLDIFNNKLKTIIISHFNIRLLYYLLLLCFTIIYKNIYPIFGIILCINPLELKILYLLLQNIGYISNYNIYHLLYITYIYYIIIKNYNLLFFIKQKISSLCYNYKNNKIINNYF